MSGAILAPALGLGDPDRLIIGKARTLVDTSVQHSNAVYILETATTIANWQAVGGTQHDAIDAVIGLTYNNSGTIFGQRDGIYFGGAIVPVVDPETYAVTYEFKAYQGGTAKITNSGSIFGGPGNGIGVPAGAAVDFAAGVGTAILTNHASGAIDGPVGVYSEATDTRITNAGSIAGDTGIELQANAAGRIANSGLIQGTSIGILVNAIAGFSISNTGTIEGGSHGILLQAGGSSVLNTGSIIGNGFGIQALGISVVDNRGFIAGDLDLTGTLKNSGEIAGNVTFGGGDDVVTNSGLIDGSFNLGGGSDTYKASGSGSVAGAIEGGAGNDTLQGGSDDDLLDGGADADHLSGGYGSDTATYANAGSAVIASLANASINTSEAAGDTYVSIENLVGSAYDDALNGDNAVNVIHGGNGLDTIKGYGGDDALHGDGGNDVLIGGIGADTLLGGDGSDTASYAGAAAGVVASLANPTINTGEAGGDSYISIENLTGTGFADSLFGSNERNVLSGGAGTDMFKSYGGNDTLTGGAGADIFVFNSALDAASNVDTITDYNLADDTIHLDDAFFTALATGALAASAFKDIVGGAKDADDRIIYNSDTGALYYDADGSGIAFGNVKFAALTGAPDLTTADFIVI